MIRLVVVDDEPLVRAGLRMVLDPAGDIEVVSEASDGGEAVRAVNRDRPDVVLMDVRMPGMDGLTALTRIHHNPDPPKVIMLTTFDLDEYVHRALGQGAAGFLLKDTTPGEFATAIRMVDAGDAMFSPAVTRRLIAAYAAQSPTVARDAQRRLDALTERERQVARNVAAGMSNHEIAGQLRMSETTVKAHVSRSMSKLALSNRVQLALLVRDAEGR